MTLIEEEAPLNINALYLLVFKLGFYRRRLSIVRLTDSGDSTLVSDIWTTLPTGTLEVAVTKNTPSNIDQFPDLIQLDCHDTVSIFELNEDETAKIIMDVI